MAGTLRSRLCTAWGPSTPTVRASFDFGVERLCKRFLICVGRVFCRLREWWSFVKFFWPFGCDMSGRSWHVEGLRGVFFSIWCGQRLAPSQLAARALPLSFSSLHTLGLSPFSRAATALSLLFGHLGMRVSCHHASPYPFAQHQSSRLMTGSFLACSGSCHLEEQDSYVHFKEARQCLTKQNKVH